MFNIIKKDDYAKSILLNVKNIIDCPIESCKKWKLYNNQVVLKSSDCFYKIYINRKTNIDYFLIETRRSIADVYSNDLHIKWDLLEYENDDFIMQIEKREPVEVCSEKNIGSFENLFTEYNKTLKRIEDKLGLKYVTYTVKQSVKDLYSIRLLRECLNKYIDYGITKDGNVILLDDSDFYLVMANKNGDTILYPNTNFEVRIKDTTKHFLSFKDDNRLERLYELNYKWILNSQDIKDNDSSNILLLKDKTEKIFADNLKFLTTNHLDNKLFVDTHNKNYEELLNLNWNRIENKK